MTALLIPIEPTLCSLLAILSVNVPSFAIIVVSSRNKKRVESLLTFLIAFRTILGAQFLDIASTQL